MGKQPEQILEEQLVAQLQKLGYVSVVIRDEKDLIANLKSQLEKHNNIKFSGAEFDKVVRRQSNLNFSKESVSSLI